MFFIPVFDSDNNPVCIVPHIQFPLAKNRVMALIGGTPNDTDIENVFEVNNGVKVEYWGRIDDCISFFGRHIETVAEFHGWDFSKTENPHILVIHELNPADN